MLFCQWSVGKSFRDAGFSINRQAHKLYHLALSEVKHSTLFDANKLHQNYKLYACQQNCRS